MARDRGSPGCTLQLIIVLVIVLGGMLLLDITPGRLLEGLRPPPPQERELTPAAVRRALPLNRLETTVMVIDQLIEGKREGNMLQNLLFSDRLLLQTRGEVIAGVDMSKLKEADIVVRGKTVSVTLPSTEILGSQLDNSATYVYQRETGLLTSGDPQMESQARMYAEARLIPAACDQQILQQAAAQAQENVTNLLKLLGFEQITVVAPIGECPS